jgi:hypothetical protein
MTTPITMEDTVTDMQSEHVDTLKREIETKDRLISNKNDEINILAHILSEVIDSNDISPSHISEIMDEMTADRSTIIEILDGYNVVANHWFVRDYEVTISVPVSLTMTVEAISQDAAEEDALARLDWGRITDYDLDYSVYYDAEIMEVREV